MDQLGPSPNFAFLAAHDPQLVRIGADAERFFPRDPDISLIRLRQFGERLAQRAAALAGLYVANNEGQADLLRRLQDRGLMPPDISRYFHSLRRIGNEAAHDLTGTHRQALLHLQVAHALGIWFHRTFGPDRRFQPARFVPPRDPVTSPSADPAAARVLQEQIDTLRQEVESHRSEAEAARAAAEESERRRLEAEELARREAEDRKAALALAEESESQRLALAAELALLQERATNASVAEREALYERARVAGDQVELDEAATRALIDEQLRQAGWEADSQLLRFARGTRPQRGRNLAIAEWPTASGPADYVLFVGLVPVAIVEAKRGATDVPGVIEQAKRYGQSFLPASPGDWETPPGGPWGSHKLPFLFATNGRPYLRQVETKSGVWFLDARRPQNHPRALAGWYTPDGLQALLHQDVNRAEAALLQESPENLTFLYPFQVEAIRAVEAALARGQRRCLLAMATGTSKTRTAIGLIYRLLKTGRCRRILFLVDRFALGQQVGDAFRFVQVDSLLALSQIFNLTEVGNVTDTDTEIHVATVQGMARRVLVDDDVRPPVDAYDCIIVDECHRGYLLDRDVAESELDCRDQADYISAYRRVLEHFDAVQVGLTATPALHTVDIFGRPVFRYTYRRAVIEGYLVDHEPPVHIRTALAADGMIWRPGEEMLLLDPRTGVLDTTTVPDEVKIDIDGFNRVVITEAFNRAVCEELARHIDPSFQEKSIVFCVDDDHADLVVTLLKQAFTQQYGGVDDEVVQKITGAADRPLEKIRRFKNEHMPTVAVTVDLLSTGIDVPQVTNLVFLRRVRSRILYEQMLGRATRLCPEIAKECFRLYDAVNLYAALAPVTEMKPVAVDPRRSFARLAELLADARQQGPEGDDALQPLIGEVIAKLRRKRNVLIQENAEALHRRCGMDAAELAQHLLSLPAAEAADWLVTNRGLADLLDRLTGPVERKVVSVHPDHVREVSHGYGEGYDRPEEYLEAFDRFIIENLHRIPALLAVAQRPRELTREQLREVQFLLDSASFSDLSLRTAWRERTNEDVAASIIGHVRRAALGDPLVPFAERVDRALRTILASRSWTGVQRTWLQRIAQQVKNDVVIDRGSFEEGAFRADGGFRRLDKVFEGRLTDVLGDLQEEIWRRAS